MEKNMLCLKSVSNRKVKQYTDKQKQYNFNEQKSTDLLQISFPYFRTFIFNHVCRWRQSVLFSQEYKYFV